MSKLEEHAETVWPLRVIWQHFASSNSGSRLRTEPLWVLVLPPVLGGDIWPPP